MMSRRLKLPSIWSKATINRTKPSHYPAANPTQSLTRSSFSQEKQGDMKMKNVPTTKSQQHQQKRRKSILGRVVTEMVGRGRAFSKNETPVTSKRSQKGDSFSVFEAFITKSPEAEPQKGTKKAVTRLHSSWLNSRTKMWQLVQHWMGSKNQLDALLDLAQARGHLIRGQHLPFLLSEEPFYCTNCRILKQSNIDKHLHVNLYLEWARAVLERVRNETKIDSYPSSFTLFHGLTILTISLII